VNADHNPNHLAFMAGAMQRNFTSYFTLAYLLKEPIPTLLLTAFGLFVLLRGKTPGLLAKLFLVLPPLVLLAAHSFWADNLGIRYIIPMLPFLWLVAGIGVARLLAISSPWPRILVAALAVWLIVTAAGIYPDHLSYFNEAACLPGNATRIGLDGGTRCGPQWFDESNVDWGQGMEQLKTWIDQHAQGRPVHLAYFGSVPPSAYGLSVELIRPDDLLAPPPGLYVISAHWVAQASGHGATWLQTTPPKAIIGHALYVYER